MIQRYLGPARSANSVKATLAALVVFSVLPSPALAQVPPPPPPPPAREGSAEFALVGTTGNSSTQTIGLRGEFIYRPSPWESKFKVGYVRNESEDELKAEALVLSVRAQRPIKPRLSGYGQVRVPTRSIRGHP